VPAGLFVDDSPTVRIGVTRTASQAVHPEITQTGFGDGGIERDRCLVEPNQPRPLSGWATVPLPTSPEVDRITTKRTISRTNTNGCPERQVIVPATTPNLARLGVTPHHGADHYLSLGTSSPTGGQGLMETRPDAEPDHLGGESVPRRWHAPAIAQLQRRSRSRLLRAGGSQRRGAASSIRRWCRRGVRGGGRRGRCGGRIPRSCG
jgi:hypothetical protein